MIRTKEKYSINSTSNKNWDKKKDKLKKFDLEMPDRLNIYNWCRIMCWKSSDVSVEKNEKKKNWVADHILNRLWMSLDMNYRFYIKRTSFSRLLFLFDYLVCSACRAKKSKMISWQKIWIFILASHSIGQKRLIILSAYISHCLSSNNCSCNLLFI